MKCETLQYMLCVYIIYFAESGDYFNN